jgi:hypothetical protein
MGTDVKVTMTGNDYQMLKILLKYMSGKLTVGAVQGALLSMGYRDEQVTDINNRLNDTIKYQAERLNSII